MTSPVLPQINPEAEDDPRISALAKLLTGSVIPPTLAPQRPPSTMLAGQNPHVMANLAQQARPTSLAELAPPNVNLQPSQPKLDLGGVVRGPQNQQANAQTGEPVPHPYDQSTYDQLVAKRNAFAKPIDRNQYKPGIGRTIGAILLGALAGPRGAESVGENVLWGKYNRAKEMQGENLKNADKELSEFETNQSRIHSSDTEALNNWYRGKESEYGQVRLDDANRRIGDSEQKLKDTEQKLYDSEHKPDTTQTRKKNLDELKAQGYKFSPKEERDYMAMGEGGLKKDDFSSAAAGIASTGKAIQVAEYRRSTEDRLRQQAQAEHDKLDKSQEGQLDPATIAPKHKQIDDKLQQDLADLKSETDTMLGLTGKAGKSLKSKSVPQRTNGENAQNATPQTHVFSKSAWAKANPGKDVNAAAQFAQNKGYQVAP